MSAPVPAELLRRAAAVLRKRVQALGDNRGPWYVGPRAYPQTVSNKGVPYVVADCFDGPQRPPVTAPYIATVHPGVGLALAELLEHAAERLAATTHPGWQDVVAPHELAVARAVLGDEADR